VRRPRFGVHLGLRARELERAEVDVEQELRRRRAERPQLRGDDRARPVEQRSRTRDLSALGRLVAESASARGGVGFRTNADRIGG
jgi:hypothetical protein